MQKQDQGQDQKQDQVCEQIRQRVRKHIRIVLVEPAGPLNVGSVARVMKNMGLETLVLVNPHCDPVGAEARQMAVHAADILEAAQTVDSIPAALTGCYRAIATTGRPRAAANLEHPRQALPWLIEQPSALIFGPEDRGLNNAELNYAQRFIGIPSNPVYPSLNLAQAVAVCCYELYQFTQAQANQTAPFPAVEPALQDSDALVPDPLASMDALEGYFQHLEQVLLEIGFLLPHTAPSRMQKLRQIFGRSQLSEAELALLRGILRQTAWAVQQQPSQGQN
ncbi:MAG: RNA methyltransferase [Thermosynechococcaceae cyanobacterium MS004]|nr:RNA methyltransferase [Thermosynechococcaceae cyanobacterium MS004]